MSESWGVLIITLAIGFPACTPSPPTPSQELAHIWSSTNTSAVERRDAINRCFTNGTPISRVVASLGKNYELVIPYSGITLDGSKLTRSLNYRLSSREFIGIGTTAALDEDELTGRFTGAGVCQLIPLSEFEVAKTNGNEGSQPSGAANRSQPIRAETNRTSAAAGSGR